jgi:hypothetical protein
MGETSSAMTALIARRRRSTAAPRREAQSRMRLKNEAFKSSEELRAFRAFSLLRASRFVSSWREKSRTGERAAGAR